MLVTETGEDASDVEVASEDAESPYTPPMPSGLGLGLGLPTRPVFMELPPASSEPETPLLSPPVLYRQTTESYPPHAPVLERQAATIGGRAPVDLVLNRQSLAPTYEPFVVTPSTSQYPNSVVKLYEEKLRVMEEMIKSQTDMMANLTRMQKQVMDTPGTHTIPVEQPATTLTPTPSGVHVASLASWPTLPTNLDTPPSNVKESLSAAGKESMRRTFAEVYADEHVDVSEHITFTDASAGRWGAMPQTQTNVGMRTRGLLLNPTLQQPSIGGLM